MKLTLIGVVAMLALGAGPGGQASRTFTGVVSDEMCGLDHASMRMGDTDAECTLACVEAHGATFVLVDDEHVYNLSDQATPKSLAGKRVKVVGTLDQGGRTIRVESMTAE